MSICEQPGTRQLLLVILAILLLHGCAGKQGVNSSGDQGAQSSFPTDSSLSSAEMTALNSTDQIDKNVPKAEMSDIAQHYRSLLRDKRNTMCVVSKRSEPYLAYAKRVFREKNMPEELAYLAIVESGYKTDAKSRAGAAGAWQFMPSTGKNYGLTQDWWQDDRLDPYRATEAAASYLQKLYNDFGDWPTAIAAYNAGEGKVSRAMQYTGSSDFYGAKAKNASLDEQARLADETKRYVPKFIAVSKIMRNLPELGFEPIDPESQEPVHRFKAYPGVDLKAMSIACNLDWAEFSSYNRHHKRTITCTDRETYIYVPGSAKQQAANYLSSSRNNSYAGWKPQLVAANGDSLQKISKRANIPLEKLQSANPGLDRLKSGQIILAPSIAAAHLRNFREEMTKNVGKMPMQANKTASGAYASHTLKAGETLFAVAQKYNSDVDSIKKHNGITDPSRLKAGQNLRVPVRNAQMAVASGSGSLGKRRNRNSHVVQAKDSLWNIAKTYRVSVDDLKRWNNVNENSLKPGDRLYVEK